MTDNWLLNFVFDHPFIAFLMLWPIGLSLITVSWLVASSMENGMNLILRLANLAVNAFVITVRGYAPQSIEAEEIDKEEKGDEGKDES